MELFVPHKIFRSSRWPMWKQNICSQAMLGFWKNRNIQKQGNETYSVESISTSSFSWLILGASWYKISWTALAENSKQEDFLMKIQTIRMTIRTILMGSSDPWKSGRRISFKSTVRNKSTVIRWFCIWCCLCSKYNIKSHLIFRVGLLFLTGFGARFLWR